MLEALDAVAAETGAALATIALAWTTGPAGIAAALASATSVEQLKQTPHDLDACELALAAAS